MGGWVGGGRVRFRARPSTAKTSKCCSFIFERREEVKRGRRRGEASLLALSAHGDRFKLEFNNDLHLVRAD